MATSVILEYERIVNWNKHITLKEDVYNWLVENVSLSDSRFWVTCEALVRHMSDCAVECVGHGTPCEFYDAHETWGWSVDYSNKMIAVVFRDPKDAVLFKLTWGGV